MKTVVISIALLGLAWGSPPVCTGADGIAKEVLERAQAATVLIETAYRPLGKQNATEKDDIHAAGSGFIVSSEGLILTNQHVVASIKEHEGKVLVLHSVSVRLHSGTNRTKLYTASVLATRPAPMDLALLRIAPEAPLPALDLLKASAGAKQPGTTDPVWAIGFPHGAFLEKDLHDRFQMGKNPNGPDISVRQGNVTSLRHNDAGQVKGLEISANIEPGNSGGPVLDNRGRVVGIVSMGTARSGLAIPLAVILREFPRTLARAAAVHQGAASKTLHVDATPAKDGVYHDLAEAVAAAQPGDTVEVAAGKYPITSDLTLPTGVRLIGAGASGFETSRTNIESENRFRRLTVADGAELADVELNVMLAIAPNAGPETFIHDTSVAYWSDIAFNVGRDASPSVVACRFRSYSLGFIHGKEAQPRIERAEFYGQIEVYDAKPVFEGCQWNNNGRMSALTVRKAGAPVVRGCAFQIQSATAIRIHDAGAGTVQLNRFDLGLKIAVPSKSGGEEAWVTTGTAVEVLDQAKARVENNTMHGAGSAICLSGQGARAEILDNRSELEGTQVSARDGAEAEVNDNRFVCARTGLWIHGKDTRVSYRGNHFDLKAEGVGVHLLNGAPDLDQGDNDYQGAGESKKRATRND